MKNKLLGFASAIVLLATNQLSTASCCGPDFCGPDPCCSSNWYVAASGSVAWHNDHEFDTSGVDAGVPFTLNNSRNYKVGGGAAASLGYIFNICNCWDLRLEGEFVWRRNSLKNIHRTLIENGVPPIVEIQPASGYTQDIALMANLIADFPLYCDLGFYVGGGIGVSFNKISLSSVNGEARSPAKRSDELFAWQLLTGLSYKICPNTALTVGYRLFATEKVHSAGANLKSNNIPLTHSIDFGIRFGF